MTELERVKEFMEALEFNGYIDNGSTKLNALIEDYYPLNKNESLHITFEMLKDKGVPNFKTWLNTFEYNTDMKRYKYGYQYLRKNVMSLIYVNNILPEF